MTSKEWEDICISFDEYGMQPATLCDNVDEVINNFRKAFKDVSKDLELLEQYKRVMCEPIKDIMKELELKDLLEIELNVERTKIEYLMKQLKKQDEILINLKRPLLFRERKKLSEEYIEWATKNNIHYHDLINMITWCFCFKMKEWLENDSSYL